MSVVVELLARAQLRAESVVLVEEDDGLLDERHVRRDVGSGEPMVLEDAGLVFRDIHRRGVGRLGRMLEGTLHCLGRSTAWNGRKQATAFRVNAECRPYHLGWVLYAAGLAGRVKTKAVTEDKCIGAE